MADKVTPAEVMRQPLCALYARVSTDDQTCDLQLRELREYCDRRGWKVYGEYVDTGWSGSRADRPQLGKLMRDARMRRFDAILVWKLDRFGRSCVNLLENMEELRAHGVRFMAVTQTLDTDDANPTSRLLFTILAAVAEFERSMIRERVKAGINAAHARGVKSGRRPKIWDRDRAVQLHLTGKTVRQIAAAVGVSAAQIQRTLKDRLKPSA